MNVDKAVAACRQDAVDTRVDPVCQECDKCAVCIGVPEALLGS